MSTIRKLSAAAILALTWAWVASSFAQTVVFKDVFESPTSSATFWQETGDNDPTAPLVGPNWVVQEAQPHYVQEVRHPQNLTNGFSYPSFAPASGSGDQYLHVMIGGEAWAPIATADQALMQGATALDLTTKIFGLSGHDGWSTSLRLAAFDSAATVGTSPAFDLRFLDGGYGVDGIVQYINSVGQPQTIPGMTFRVNTWQDLTVQADFVTDTFSVALNGVRVSGLSWFGGDLSKIQSVELTALNSFFRGGFDDFTIVVPEPAVVSLVTLGSLPLLFRRRRP